MGDLRPRWALGARRASLALLLLTGCRDPTEVTLVIGTDTCTMDAGYNGTNIGVVSTQTQAAEGKMPMPPVAQTTNCSADGGIGTLTVVPGVNGNGPFIVTVATGLSGVSPDLCTGPDAATTCIIETRELTLLDNTPMVLPIRMSRICENVKCGSGLTCQAGTCVTALIDTTTCTSDPCTVTIVDGGGKPPINDSGIPHDTGADAPIKHVDAGHDANHDAGHDAGHDATVNEAGRDSGHDATLPEDSGHDAGHDSGHDAKKDTAPPPPCPDGGVLCGGECTPTCLTPIAEGQRFPWALVVDQGMVYWTTGCYEDGGLNCPTGPGGSVQAAPSQGGTGITLATTGNTPPAALAVGGPSVVWSSYGSCTGGVCTGSVKRVGRDGGTPVPLAVNPAYPLGLAVSEGAGGDSVFWVSNINAAGGAATGAVVRVSLDGGGTVTIAKSQQGPGGIAVNGPNVYWTSFGPYDSMNNTAEMGTVTRAALDGGGVATLASALDYAVNVAAAGDGGVFWITQGYDFDAGVVGGLPSGPGGSTTKVAIPTQSWNVAYDGTHVYWANPVTGEIYRAPKAGGTVVTLAKDAGAPMYVAVDDASVYWTNSGSCPAGECNGSVMKLTPK